MASLEVKCIWRNVKCDESICLSRTIQQTLVWMNHPSPPPITFKIRVKHVIYGSKPQEAAPPTATDR